MGPIRIVKLGILLLGSLLGTPSANAATPYTLMTAFTSLDYAADFQSLDYIDFAETLRPPGPIACSFQTARTPCANDVSTVSWEGCTVGEATLSGGWTEVWSEGFCPNGTKPGRLAKGVTVTRTSTGEIVTQPSNSKIVTRTTAHTAYDGSFIPGNGVRVTSQGKNRSVVISGIQRTITGPSDRVWFDQSIMSTGLVVSGTRGAGTRTITGELTLLHNLALYKAVHTFDTVRWGNPQCCYPTSGRVTTQLTGEREGDVALTFTGQCSEGQFTDTDGAVSSVTLPDCP